MVWFERGDVYISPEGPLCESMAVLLLFAKIVTIIGVLRLSLIILTVSRTPIHTSLKFPQRLLLLSRLLQRAINPAIAAVHEALAAERH